MAAKMSEENLFECTICLENFEEPKILQCYHTFCKNCLSSHISKNRMKGNKFPCPNCRAETKIPKGGVDGFQTNFYITAALKSALDMKNKFLEMSLDKSTVKGASDNLHGQLCPKHKAKNQVLQFFCVKCDTPICMHCKLTSHERHETKDLEDIINKTKGELNGLSKKLESYLSVYKAKRESSNKMEKSVDHECQTAKASVIESAEALHDMIDNRKNYLLDIINKNQKKEANKHVQYTKDVDRHTRQMDKMISTISKEESKNDFVSLLKMKTDINQQMKKIKESPAGYSNDVKDVSFTAPERCHNKMKEVINSYMGKVRVEHSNGKILYNGQTASSSPFSFSFVQLDEGSEPPIALAKHARAFPGLGGKSTIRSMVDDNRGNIWLIYDPISPRLQKISPKGKSLTSVNIAGKDISGITLMNGTDMVLSCPSQKLLLNLTGVHKAELNQSFRSNLPHTPVAVYHCNGQVYALLSGNGSWKGIYNSEKMSWMFQNSMLKKPVDFAVLRVGVKLIAVISDSVGRQVVFLEENGGKFDLKSVFKGQGLGDDQQPKFQPKGITVTNDETVLVVDEGNGLIPVLDIRTGKAKSIVTLIATQIRQPRTILFTKNRTWIGDANGLIHAVTIPYVNNDAYN